MLLVGGDVELKAWNHQPWNLFGHGSWIPYIHVESVRPRTNPMNKLWRRASPVAWIFPRVHTICHQLKQEQQQQKGDRTRPVGVAGNCIKGKPFSFFFLHFPAAPSRGLRFFISSWPSANERSHQTPSIKKHGPRCRLDSHSLSLSENIVITSSFRWEKEERCRQSADRRGLPSFEVTAGQQRSLAMRTKQRGHDAYTEKRKCLMIGPV